MIDTPAIGGDISALEAVAAVALFVTGYALHEALHVLPLLAWGHDYRVHILPTDEGGSKLRALLVGPLVRIDMHDRPPRRHVVVSALAPLAIAVFPMAGMALALSRPVVDSGTLIVLVAWFSVSIPSLADWLTVLRYRPDTVDSPEVVADG